MNDNEDLKRMDKDKKRNNGKKRNNDEDDDEGGGIFDTILEFVGKILGK